MTIELPIDPADIPTAQEKGVRIVNVRGKPIPMFYKSAALQKFEARLEELLKPHYRNLRVPDDQAAQVHVTYLFAYPKSTPKRDRVHMARMIRRPDGDNLSKAIVDALGDKYVRDKRTRVNVLVRRGFFADDGAVNPLIISKYYVTDEPRLVISISARETKPLANPSETPA